VTTDEFGGATDHARRNARLAWPIVGLLALAAVWLGLEGSYRWFSFTGMAAVLIVLPAVLRSDPRAVPPWELLGLTAVPVVDAAVLGGTVVSPVATYLAVATVALIVAVDLHTFTDVRMNRAFAVGFVVIATLAVAATWNVALWLADVAVGTEYLVGDHTEAAANRAMMIDFLYAAVAGLLAGLLFTAYLRVRSIGRIDWAAVDQESTADAPDPPPTLVRGRFDVPEHTARRISRTFQVALAVLLVYGLLVRDVPTITNASIALGVTFLPTVLERNYRVPIEPELVVWVALAAILHTLGSAGLYDFLPVWDSLTHALSASLVAATGYTAVRAIDLYSDAVYLPPKTTFAFILVFGLAVGVVWELAEFAVDQASRRLGLEAALAQHGATDTVTDLLFDLLGAVAAAALGAAYLTESSRQLADRLDD